MYESELAPEGYKENARQHPRAVPVISEKHVLPSSVKQGSELREDPLSPNQAGGTTSPNKTITETVTEKLAPAYATVSDATHAIASKIQNLAVSATAAATPQQQQQSGSAPAAPQMNPITAASGSMLAPVATQSYSAPSCARSAGAQAGKNVSVVDQQIWDRGVSVKQYLMHKFEPGDDERALSQVISEAMSPRKTGGGGGEHVGVVEKVKEAVTSLLRHDHQEPSSSISKSAYTRSATMPPTTSRIPISTNAHEGPCTPCFFTYYFTFMSMYQLLGFFFLMHFSWSSFLFLFLHCSW